MKGYDPDTWTWDTEEVSRWIQNTEFLYEHGQGLDAASLRHLIIDYIAVRDDGLPDVNTDAVQWDQLAQFYGADPAPDAHLDDVGD
jgi:hypothetical protein